MRRVCFFSVVVLGLTPPAYGQDVLPPPTQLPSAPGTVLLPEVPPILVTPMTLAEFAKGFPACAGKYEVLLVNPVTCAPAKVCFELPPGHPKKVRAFKRQVVAFRRASAPLLDPAGRLVRGGVPFVPDALQPYLRDVLDHLTKANEQVEALDRLLSDILSANLAQVSVQQNNDMRKISAWAALVAAPTMIAGVYGMNFEHMPELSRWWAYPLVLVLMAAACAALHRMFKRRGWL